MRYPLNKEYPTTQDFNDPRYRGSYLQFGLMGHNGWDIGCPTGTAILAPHEGIIMEIMDEGIKGYGKYIKIENNKEGSVLAHLKEFKVSVNQEVKEGEVIAYSNNTGNSTGPHLHWGYYRISRNRNNGFAGFIDQADWLNPAIITQPIAQEFTDQTEIPGKLLNSPGFPVDKDSEIQAIRGWLGDFGRAKMQIISLQTEINVLDEEIKKLNGELETQGKAYDSLLRSYNALKSSNSTESELVTETIAFPPIISKFFRWLFSKLR